MKIFFGELILNQCCIIGYLGFIRKKAPKTDASNHTNRIKRSEQKQEGYIATELIFSDGIRTKSKKEWQEKQAKLESIIEEDWLLNQPRVYLKKMGFTWLYPQKTKYFGDYTVRSKNLVRRRNLVIFEVFGVTFSAKKTVF